jgi:hypothetical protein
MSEITFKTKDGKVLGTLSNDGTENFSEDWKVNSPETSGNIASTVEDNSND